MCVEVSLARHEPSVRGGQSLTKTIGTKVCGSFCHRISVTRSLSQNLRNRFLQSNLGDAGDKHQFKIGILVLLGTLMEESEHAALHVYVERGTNLFFYSY